MLLPGDGIGPEIMAEVEKVVNWISDAHSVSFAVSHGLIGGCSYDEFGVPLSDETLTSAKATDAIIMGAVGGPNWDGVDYEKRPEAGLLRLRKELDAFANLRPAICFDALADASSLKRELVSGLDILFVRELSSGVYFGEPRGIETLEDGSRVGINTQRYTEAEIERIAHVGFEMARKRGGRVASAEKSNVMEAGLLWRQIVTEIHEKHYIDVELSHILADNCAMQLVKNPKQFDVILTDNLFGDLLSDEAAMLTGSLGMLPSASLGNGDLPGLYEPVHGSAPDIAGKGIANPIAAVLSFAMALRYSLNMGLAATAIEQAVDQVLADNIRTADIYAEGAKRVSTSQMGDALLKKLDDM
jgi:3-isopropylmalate dehydrogenase